MAEISQTTVNRMTVASVIAGFVILVAIGGLGVLGVQRNLEFAGLVSHTHEVQVALGDFRVSAERLETARRGYLLARDPAFRATYQKAAAELPPQLQHLQALTRDNPRQQQRLATLSDLTHRQIAAGDAAFSGAARVADFEADPGVVALRQSRTVNLAMEQEEERLLAAREADLRTSIHNLVVIGAVGAALLAAVALGSTLIILRFVRDLTASRRELQALNAGLEEAVANRTADLQRANDEIQRFAYIVSHDLRSPLVNVMGFTSELEAAVKPLNQLIERAEAEAPQVVADDARRAVREDLPESLGFIRTSTQKMDRLINAILQLSRQGRRVLTPEPLSMRRVIEGIQGSLKHRIDELGATVVVARDLPDIISDRLALEQVFSNLIENALKYRRAGQAPQVEVRGRREGPRVIYEVVDNGRGVDPKDHERIFELFRRSGAQDQPGEGIGLAHVRALVYRLGGVISVDSRLDQGATFRVSLPLQLSGERAPS